MTDNQNQNQNDNGGEPSPEQMQERFNGMFETAMNAWVAKRQSEEESTPKRTTRPKSIFTELFGG